MNRRPNTNTIYLIIPLVLILTLFYLLIQRTTAAEQGLQITREWAFYTSQLSPDIAEKDPNSSGTEEEEFLLYLPIIIDQLTEIVIQDAWITDEDGTERISFHQDEKMQYHLSGTNNLTSTVSVNLRWTQNNPCAQSGDLPYQIVFTDTLPLPPGEWNHKFSETTPTCSGLYTPTAVIEYEQTKSNQSAEYAVNHYNSVVITETQGFDKCGLPEPWKMQAWMNHSPYRVFNLYIGGNNFACWRNPLDAIWVRNAADMGWTFIQTWVGPQAPCTSYNNTMSWDKNIAYNEGRKEADLAAEASQKLGFFGDKIIYYDIEAFHDDSPSCRDPVKSFIKGWTQRLHELGYKAGAYGSPCSSFMADWASNNPPPDDAWIATWYTNYYDPEATVSYSYCSMNNLWDDHERIKQYAGGHVEVWGEVSITIDSNVLDGEVNKLDGTENAVAESAPITVIDIYGTPIQNMGMLGPQQGWILTDGTFFLTNNNGERWAKKSPSDQQVISATFMDSQRGWLVGRKKLSGDILISKTVDGGETWTVHNLPLSYSDANLVQSAHIIQITDSTAWASLKLHSGSSFSVGKLYFTENAGDNWHERQVPLGDEVTFLDEYHGWVTGGPTGDQLFRTIDGGHNWIQSALPISSAFRTTIGHPVFSSSDTGWVPAVIKNETGRQLSFFTTDDGGTTWVEDYSIEISPYTANLASLAGGLTYDTHIGESMMSLTPRITNLPEGTVYIDFFDVHNGWAVIQNGSCLEQTGSSEQTSRRCFQRWQLMATDDGGVNWHELIIR